MCEKNYGVFCLKDEVEPTREKIKKFFDKDVTEIVDVHNSGMFWIPKDMMFCLVVETDEQTFQTYVDNYVDVERVF